MQEGDVVCKPETLDSSVELAAEKRDRACLGGGVRRALGRAGMSETNAERKQRLENDLGIEPKYVVSHRRECNLTRQKKLGGVA